MNIVYLLQSVYEQVQYDIFRVSMILNEILPILQLIESTLVFMQTDYKNDCVFRNIPLLKLRS